jgi:hypothetical protein
LNSSILSKELLRWNYIKPKIAERRKYMD